MRVIWEAKDIRPGTIVGKSLTTERFIIAYRTNPETLGNLFALVSLSDGLILNPDGASADVMASSLTASGRVPVEFLETKFGGE